MSENTATTYRIPYKVTTDYRLKIMEFAGAMIGIVLMTIVVTNVFKKGHGYFEISPEIVILIVSACSVFIAARKYLITALAHIFGTVEMTVDDLNFTVSIKVLFHTTTNVFPLTDISHIRTSNEEVTESAYRVSGIPVYEEKGKREVLEFKFKGQPQQIGLEWNPINYAELKREIAIRKREL